MAEEVAADNTEVVSMVVKVIHILKYVVHRSRRVVFSKCTTNQDTDITDELFFVFEPIAQVST